MRNTFGQSIKLAAVAALVGAGPAWAQTAPLEKPAPARFEVGGVGGGSALFSSGGFGAADAMWGIKGAAFGGDRRRFGLEGTFERSAQYRDVSYLGGDFLFQFAVSGAQRAVPFVHAGVGAFLYQIGQPEAALSFGGGVKIPLSRRLGLRFGVQDRLLFTRGSYHRFDLYGGIFFRF